VDYLDREPTKCERLNIVAYEICDVVRATAQGSYGVRPNCGLWPNERCGLFIREVKIKSNWKERLTQQLLDGDLQEYLMEKEQWTTRAFNNICWKRNKTALKRLSKAIQAQNAKMCHNLRHTGVRHEQWYSKAKPCWMCGDNEDWRQVITCKSLDDELIRADSWSKLRKTMEKWGMSKDMWIAIENGVRHYTVNPKKRDPDNMPPEPPPHYTVNPKKHDPDNMPPEPPPSFGPTFNAPRNRLKVAFRAQSQMGWDNFLRERLSRD
jgi:hypothetical protein